MTDNQLYLAIGVPILFNTAFLGIVITLMNRNIDSKFEAMGVRLAAIEQRLNDLRELWRAELHRVEEILGAGLKHLEEARG